MSKEKEISAHEIAVENDCYLVDLSHLGSGTDLDNFASSQRRYAIPGVGRHPVDLGMDRIAEQPFTIIHPSLQ